MKKISFFLAIVMVLSVLLSSCSANDYETVMEYNGIKLTEDMYNYWVSTFKRNILTGYSDAADTDEFWNKQFDDTKTVGEYFSEVVNKRIKYYLIAESLYKENRLKLSSDVKDKIDADIKEKIEYYGSRSALNSELKNLMLNIDSLKDVYTWEEKYNCVYNYLYGENGTEKITDEQLNEYYKKNYSRIKYIVFYTTGLVTDADGKYVYDADGNLETYELSEEELSEKQKLIEECFGKLKSGENIDTLAKQYSEYNTEQYENGFYVSPNELGTWGADIIVASGTAAVGDVFRVDEDDAVFLIQKLELTELEELTETESEQLSQLLVYATGEYSSAKFDKLAENVILNDEIIGKYKISKVKPNPYYGF